MFIANKVTSHADLITLSSKKIERIVNSSPDAETFGVTKLIGTLYLIKEVYKQMYGTKMGDVLCVTFVDSKDLYKAVHNINHIQVSPDLTIQDGGKNLFATNFGHILVISSGIKSKRVQHNDATRRKKCKKN